MPTNATYANQCQPMRITCCTEEHSGVSRVYLGCISGVSRVYLGCITCCTEELGYTRGQT